MTFDEKTRQKLLGLSDAELSDLVGRIAEAAGAGGIKAAAVKSNIGGLRKTLQGMSEADAAKLLSGVDRSRLDEISRIIKGV